MKLHRASSPTNDGRSLCLIQPDRACVDKRTKFKVESFCRKQSSRNSRKRSTRPATILPRKPESCRPSNKRNVSSSTQGKRTMVEWLKLVKQSHSHWPVHEPVRQTAPECLVEARKEGHKVLHASCLVCLPSVEESTLELAARYETWQRLVRITAWILKWLRLRGQPKKGKLSAQEIKESE